MPNKFPNGLPKKLGKEPILDAVFELRFADGMPLSHILPGFLISKFSGQNPTVVSLPTNDIPLAIRSTDPNFKYLPLTSLELENFRISFSDQSMIVGCKLPYMGWAMYKQVIISALKHASELPFLVDIPVTRYSMKYTNLIEAETTEQQNAMLDLNLTISNFNLEKENFQIRIDKNDEKFARIISLASSAQAITSKGQIRGVIVDIDTIKETNSQKFSEIFATLDKDLEDLRLANKIDFFECLTTDTVDSLEPEYEKI